jgi:hypothetical protein
MRVVLSIYEDTTRVSPPVLGGVAAASADGVVLFGGDTTSYAIQFSAFLLIQGRDIFPSADELRAPLLV